MLRRGRTSLLVGPGRVWRYNPSVKVRWKPVELLFVIRKQQPLLLGARYGLGGWVWLLLTRDSDHRTWTMAESTESAVAALRFDQRSCLSGGGRWWELRNQDTRRCSLFDSLSRRRMSVSYESARDWSGWRKDSVRMIIRCQVIRTLLLSQQGLFLLIIILFSSWRVVSNPT